MKKQKKSRKQIDTESKRSDKVKFEKPTLKEWNAAEKLADPVAFKTWVRRLVCRDKRYLKEVAAEMNINETGLHDRFKRGFVNINDLIKLLDSLDMDLIIRDRRYNR